MVKRKHARNKKELAALLGIGQQALANLFKRNDFPPQVPGQGYNLEQWERYANNNVAFWRNNSGDAARRSNPNLRDDAYIRRQELAMTKEQFDLDIKRGKYTPKEETRKEVMTYFGMLVREGDKAFHHELPPRLEGQSAGDIAKLLGRRWDEIRDRVATALESKNGNNGNGLPMA